MWWTAGRQAAYSTNRGRGTRSLKKSRAGEKKTGVAGAGPLFRIAKKNAPVDRAGGSRAAGERKTRPS